MKILGEFNYHRYNITLKVTNDERKFTVELIERQSLNKTVVKNNTFEYSEFSEAKKKFELLINESLYYTSSSDLWLWMQHN